MHCWFCESPLTSAGPGEIYCPFGECPACKELAPSGTAFAAPPTERWLALKDAGLLWSELLRLGL